MRERAKGEQQESDQQKQAGEVGRRDPRIDRDVAMTIAADGCFVRIYHTDGLPVWANASRQRAGVGSVDPKTDGSAYSVAGD
jgi:hypothetical protein